jgi:hypothetical protein
MSDEEIQLDEYGHHVVDGESVSGPASPGYHDPDAARLEAPEFAAEPPRITPEVLMGAPEPDGSQRFEIAEDEHAEGDAGPTGERA